jgi:hypothetical protein
VSSRHQIGSQSQGNSSALRTRKWHQGARKIVTLLVGRGNCFIFLFSVLISVSG